MTAVATQTEENNLPAARRRLDNAVSALTEPKPHTITRDNGKHTITWLPSLYDQLCGAISGNSGQRTGGHTSSPIWAAVHDMITEIENQCALWTPDMPGRAAVARLQELNDQKWRVEDTPKVIEIAATVEQWSKDIQEILTPEPAVYLMAPDPSTEPAACTACQTRRVWRRDPTNPKHKVMQPALKITECGCRCQNCGTTWEPGKLRILAAAIGYPLPAGVLE